MLGEFFGAEGHERFGLEGRAGCLGVRPLGDESTDRRDMHDAGRFVQRNRGWPLPPEQGTDLVYDPVLF